MCVSVLVVLMRERHTDRQTDRQTQREREREREMKAICRGSWYSRSMDNIVQRVYMGLL